MRGIPQRAEVLQRQPANLAQGLQRGLEAARAGIETISSTPGALILAVRSARASRPSARTASGQFACLATLAAASAWAGSEMYKQRPLARQCAQPPSRGFGLGRDQHAGQAGLLRRQPCRSARNALGSPDCVLHGHQVDLDLLADPLESAACRWPSPARRSRPRPACRRCVRRRPSGGGTSPRGGRAAFRCRS